VPPQHTNNRFHAGCFLNLGAAPRLAGQSPTAIVFCADNCSLPVCTQSISEATIIQTFPIQTLRGSIVCKISDNTFTKLRITRAYIKLLCIPEGDARVVSLVQIGNYEIRMLDVSKSDTADGPLFLIELFDQDAQSSVDSRICDDVEEGVVAFEDFISR
jgi:hypothetical protein